MRRNSMLVAVAALLLGIGGCYSARERPTESEPLQAVMQSSKGQEVWGYVDPAGVYHKFEGSVRLVGDSLEFLRPERPAHNLMREHPAERMVLHRSQVKTINAVHFSPGKTFVAVIGITVLAVAIATAVAYGNKESCPFIYSYDGERYVFDGEPYGGATMQCLERTDWSELEHLVARDGVYRLALTNEVDETQHTNSLALIVVDHSPGTTVVMDKQGVPHAFRRLARLSVARDEHGKDLREWLKEADEAAWSPDLESASREDSLVDTRNHITLTFERPAGVHRAYLVANVATGLWGSHMIRTMLSLRGNRVGDFYAAINGSEAYRRQLLEWNAREELYMLYFEVRRGDRWVRQDYVPGAGPFLSESRAIPVDLDGVEGDRVEIRLHPPIGFWSLNSFQLAWNEERLRVRRVTPKSAENQDGKDVLASLAASDSSYLDFPTKHDQARVVFAAPPPVPGTTRTIFAETRGWYELHLHTPGAPDVAAIDRMTHEPGYMVRRALREFGEYERTGRLMGAATDSTGGGDFGSVELTR